MSLNTQYRDLIVTETLDLVLRSSESASASTYTLLDTEFKLILSAIQSAYNATHVLENHTDYTPRDWDAIVREEIDPSLDSLRSTVFDMSNEIIREREKGREAAIYAACGTSSREVIALVGDFQWIHPYKLAISDHMWKIQATLWKLFSEWRLSMHIEQWSPPSRI